MIVGIGMDLCDIRRVQTVLDRHGERFLHRVFTATERAKALSRVEPQRAATLAKRFAAKEAAAKALGTGFARGVFHSDLGVRNLSGGRPVLEMTGGALLRLREITPPGLHARVLLTITDEPPYALAQVMISAEPA